MNLTERVNEFERRCLVRIMRKARGNVAQAARLAGRNRTEFYRLMRTRRIVPSTFRRSSPSWYSGLTQSSTAKPL